MSLVVNHNMMAAYTARSLNQHYGRLATSTQRLSSGLRINSAADDAAGLAIRELQRADIAALRQGARNANDAISMIQVADGALSIIDEKLVRMKELAEQAATGTYTPVQRMLIDSEYQAMAAEITRIANATDFNGIHLLDGTLSGEHDGSGVTPTGRMKIHFGTGNDAAEDYYYIEIGKVTASALGLGNTSYIAEDPNASSLNRANYEKIRNAAAQKAYDSTYAAEYAKYYPEIFNKLITGTPLNPGAVLSADEASKEADKQAKALSTQAAQTDKAMAIAALDQVYDNNWNTAYTDEYTAQIANGKTHAAANAAATEVADRNASEKVWETTNRIANDGNLNALKEGGNEMPPHTRTGADALIEYFKNEGTNAVYNTLYDKLYQEAIAQHQLDHGALIIPPEDVLKIHTAVDEAASLQANTMGNQLASNLRFVYEEGYEGRYNQTDGYLKYYADAVAQGDPHEVAKAKAEKQASNDGWNAMIDRINALVPFGTLPDPAGGDTRQLHPDQFSTPDKTVTYTNGLSITFKVTGTQADVDAVYTATTGKAKTLLGKSGFIGPEQGMVNVATEYAAQGQPPVPSTPPGVVPSDGFTVSTQQAAQKAIVAIDNAIVSKDKIRASLGALQNRLENTITNLNIQAENLQAAESRISDVDVATEMTEFVRNQILSQSAVAMLAQANSLPQMAMQLIGG